jgi:glycosyltransferase involved in cell wall biosynthesis
VGFHGNLNDATDWRSRNPLLRAFDTRALLSARLPVPTRFLVLEPSIRSALAETFPDAAERTDVLPLPINTAEIATAAETPLALPLRMGFVGLGTPAKGMDVFLSVAARLKARWGERVEFIHIGRMPPDMPPGVKVLAHPAAREPLPREEFAARLGSLHYVMLPFRKGYYDFSASGALIDALTWLKPVITTGVPLTRQFFEEYGDIGELCEDEDGLEAAVEAILAAPDAARHARQVAALRQARESRRVEVLALQYRRMVENVFPGLLPG